MSPKTIFAVDPGKLNGWCWITADKDKVLHFECGQDDMFTIGDMICNNSDSPDAYVVERYTMTSKISQAPWSLETIGMIRYFADKQQTRFELVSLSAHKDLIGAKVVRKAGLWKPGKNYEHAMDAVSVGLHHLVTKEKFLADLVRPQ